MHHFTVTKPGRMLYGVLVIFLILVLVGMVARLYFKGEDETDTGSGDDSVEIILKDGIKNIFSEREMSDMFSNYRNDNSLVVNASPITSASNGNAIGSMQTIAGIETNKKVIIYHTHDTEAYKKTNKYSYNESEVARTKNQNYSVVRIGQELAKQLYLQSGIRAVHNTSTHEQPKLSTAYSRSLKTAEAYCGNDGDDVVLIDIHRDAFSQKSWDPSHVIIDGKKVARIMIVIGKGKGYKDSPEWEKNLQYAEEITKALNEIHPDLARQVKIKDGRYNQHLSESAILIEVGHHHNTLDEAINATPYLAKVLSEVFFSLP